MEFGFALNVSFEINQRKQDKMIEFSDRLSSFLKEKTYGKGIAEMYIGLVCVSSDFAQFFKEKKKYVKSRNILEYDLKLDFEKFSSISDEDIPKSILSSFLESLDSNDVWNKVADFDMGTFKSEIKNFAEKQDFSL